MAKSTKSYDVPGGRIEVRGAWFVAYDLEGNKVGAKKGWTAALELLKGAVK